MTDLWDLKDFGRAQVRPSLEVLHAQEAAHGASSSSSLLLSGLESRAQLPKVNSEIDIGPETATCSSSSLLLSGLELSGTKVYEP